MARALQIIVPMADFIDASCDCEAELAGALGGWVDAQAGRTTAPSLHECWCCGQLRVDPELADDGLISRN
jgi:hypothetical protein